MSSEKRHTHAATWGCMRSTLVTMLIAQSNIGQAVECSDSKIFTNLGANPGKRAQRLRRLRIADIPEALQPGCAPALLRHEQRHAAHNELGPAPQHHTMPFGLANPDIHDVRLAMLKQDHL